jgi:enamine deaminase RidA (YjgF/YER057c/UK114 family)
VGNLKRTHAVFYHHNDAVSPHADPAHKGGILMPIERLHPGPRMSQVVIHNKTVYLAGQVAEEAAGKGVAEQTKEILSIIDGLLAEAKTDKTRVLSATIWLTSMSTFGEMNKVWDQWVAPGSTPARATVESAKLAGAQYKIEIAMIAAQP